MQKSGALLPIHTTLPLPSSLRQIDGLQVLRAIAVSLVAWAHAAQPFYPPGTSGPPQFGVFGIDIFFVISGFILSSVVLRERRQPGRSTMWEFLKRRIIRIFPLYWIFATYELCRIALHHELFKHNYAPAFFLLPPITHLGEVSILTAAWTLKFEMVFYYTLALILLRTVRWAVPVLATLLVIAASAGAFFNILHPVAIILCNPILLEFVLGALLALAHNRVPKKTRRLSGQAMMAVGVIFAGYLWLHPPAGVAVGLQAVMSDVGVFERVATYGIAAMFIVGGMVFWSPSFNSSLGKLLIALGNSSYSAYLAYERLADYVIRPLMKFGGPPVTHARLLTYQSIIVVSVLIFGWLCYNFVEWPMIRSLQKKFLTKPKSHANAGADLT